MKIKIKSAASIKLFVCLSLLLLGSCSSNDENPSEEFFIKGKISGQLFEFKDSATGVIGNRSFSAYAGESASSNFPSFSFDIESVPISVGEFEENDPGINMIFRYSLNGTRTFHSQMGEEQDFKIVINSIESGLIEGTFSGTIRNANSPEEALNVSEGEFRLKRN